LQVDHIELHVNNSITFLAAYLNKINADSPLPSPLPVKKNMTNDSGVAMPSCDNGVKMSTLTGRKYKPPDGNDSTSTV